MKERDKNCIFFVLLMAGSSERFKDGGNKLLLKIEAQDHPVFIYPLKFALLSRYFFRCILVYRDVILDKTRTQIESCINSGCLPEYTRDRLELVAGGRERAISSFNAIRYIRRKYSTLYEKSYILIHDAARPYLDKVVVRNILNVLCATDDGIIPYLKRRDAFKCINEAGTLESTNVEHISVQTPQAYSLARLYQAYNSIEGEFDIYRDDSTIYEILHKRILPVAGTINSHKLTYKEDFKLIQYILREHGKDLSHLALVSG
jgi:2-C-methyl-D-erythritol 4-phosphate cytidylyltransferase